MEKYIIEEAGMGKANDFLSFKILYKQIQSSSNEYNK